MKYKLEQYKNNERFNDQYNSIHEFLNNYADKGCNEHFHWARFEWMINHSMLQVENLNKIGIFRDENNKIVGIVTFDTELNDNTYILHSIDDKDLLKEMIEYATKIYGSNNKTGIFANSKDIALKELLAQHKAIKTEWKDNVLELNLDSQLKYDLPEEYHISDKDLVIDNWQYQLVIHKGFNHEGIPEKLSDECFNKTPNEQPGLKVFAINNNNEYCAHCGIWYAKGDTAYIEPVVAIPECRMKGLAKAVVYEAMNRAKELGAKRAIVLSSQEFYYKLGFKDSSEFVRWEF